MNRIEKSEFQIRNSNIIDDLESFRKKFMGSFDLGALRHEEHVIPITNSGSFALVIIQKTQAEN